MKVRGTEREASPALAPAALLSIQELAARLNCSRRSATRLLSRKEIPSLKIGALTRIAPADVDAFIMSQVSR